ncbi:sorting nexin-25 isoform X2 [Tribolium madens]|nr:sorting nexin-25 isoform X2 [Tribolium madens]
MYVYVTFACLGVSLIFSTCLSYFLFTLLTLGVILSSLGIVIWVHVKLSSRHMATVGAEHTLKDIENFRISLMRDFESSNTTKTPQAHFNQIFGRTVDSLLQQLLDFIVRDYILVYLKEYAYNWETLGENIREDLWGAIEILHDRFSRVDHAKLIACDIVSKITNHFEKIREAKSAVIDSDRPPVFVLSPHVMSSDKEMSYIRSASELFIMFLLPRSYSLSPSKYFLREILACKVFKPFVDTITDPDFFNLHVIYYIEAQKIAANVHVKAFEYAKSFDDILKIIAKTDDINALKSIRYSLVTKLMQATTLQNLNRSKGVDLDNEKSVLASAGVNKSDINAAKKLRKYINQLTVAKKESEKRLASLGWELGYQFNDDLKKSLPISSILEHVLGRKYLSQFLDTLASQDLVRYWTAVEELRTAHRKNWHQLGAEIFYTFIRNPTSEIKVDKNTRKRMEAFLLGDKGPEVFYEVQSQVVQTLEDKYYQPFLISDYYKEMIAAMEKEDDISDLDRSLEERQNSGDSISSVDSTNLNVGDHSNYAKQKLDQLEERLSNKTQALQALRSSLRPESKVLSKLEKEVEWLQGERRQLEAHLNRTEVWGENLGKWRTVVQSAEVPDEREPLQFVLVVHMAEEESNEETISTGWVVCRSLTQFQELNRKLRPLCSELRNLELPSNTFKFLFGKTDKSSLEKAKQQIQKYLDFILTDDKLNQSEAVYSFLSPSSDHLKHSTPSPKKSRFSFSTLFKSGSEQSKDGSLVLKESEEEDISQCLAPESGDTVDFVKINGRFYDDSKDTIAEPLYALLGELFDMRGVFKYLRKTLIGFVQVTYGRNINRQIYETISWWFSEQMLHYYVTLILKNFWPGGSLASAGPMRTANEKIRTAREAQVLFVSNVPELLTTLVGANAAKSGARKVFDAFQEKNMNKQLLYEIFEVLMDAAFPEIS